MFGKAMCCLACVSGGICGEPQTYNLMGCVADYNPPRSPRNYEPAVKSETQNIVRVAGITLE